jgi:hypothetical protein
MQMPSATTPCVHNNAILPINLPRSGARRHDELSTTAVANSNLLVLKLENRCQHPLSLSFSLSRHRNFLCLWSIFCITSFYAKEILYGDVEHKRGYSIIAEFCALFKAPSQPKKSAL